VVLPLLLAALFLGPPWLGAGLIAVACALALYEFFALLQARGIQPLSASGFLALGLVFLEVAQPGSLPPLMPAVLVVALLPALGRGAAPAESVTAAALTLLGGAYLGALGGSMAALHLREPVSQGPWRLVLLLAIIMVSDTAAYFVGHLWGRHRLAPAISPGKTVEGALGALAGGIPAALVVRTIAFPAMPVAHAVALGVFVTALGIAGDLSESLMKRWAGAKDSGTLFPGHGGMLDRLDSLLFGAPVLYYYFLLIP
jgi:phosphatidate cytidylyltransferase